jgi:hypothetical protein
VRDENDCHTIALELLHATDAFLLECHVSDGQHFVDDQHLRVEVCRNRKPQPGVHPTRITFHGSVNEFGDAGEIDDLVEPPGDLAALHSHNRALQEHVLASCEIGMKPCRDLNQRSDPAVHLAHTACGPEDSCQELEGGGLASPVGADNP